MSEKIKVAVMERLYPAETHATTAAFLRLARAAKKRMDLEMQGLIAAVSQATIEGSTVLKPYENDGYCEALARALAEEAAALEAFDFS